MRSALTFAAILLCGPVALADEPPPMPGSDVDVHGCKPSAGYTRCDKTARCERPWELAKAHGFKNSLAAYKAFCEG
jgi:hypothetical protein